MGTGKKPQSCLTSYLRFHCRPRLRVRAEMATEACTHTCPCTGLHAPEHPNMWASPGLTQLPGLLPLPSWPSFIHALFYCWQMLLLAAVGGVPAKSIPTSWPGIRAAC